MQSQLMCNGCRSILLYPRGATNVCCAVCNAITAVPPTGMDMAQLICGGCNMLLMYARGAASVRCSCCQTVNIAPVSNYHAMSNQFAHINCGNCRTMLMYPYGAPSVKCAICQYITNVNMGNARIPVPVHNHGGTNTAAPHGPNPSTSTQPMCPQQTQTVVVENPMTVDESGKLVKFIFFIIHYILLIFIYMSTALFSVGRLVIRKTLLGVYGLAVLSLE